MTNRFIKGLAVAVALSIAAIASTQSAFAGKGTRNFVLGTVAGVAGLAALNSLSHNRHYNRGYRYDNAGYRYRRHNYYYGNRYRYRRPYRRHYYRGNYSPRYYAPRPRYYAPRRVYRGAPPAWSPAWYRYCANKFRSFRRSDGTYQPYQGGRRLCR